MMLHTFRFADEGAARVALNDYRTEDGWSPNVFPQKLILQRASFSDDGAAVRPEITDDGFYISVSLRDKDTHLIQRPELLEVRASLDGSHIHKCESWGTERIADEATVLEPMPAGFGRDIPKIRRAASDYDADNRGPITSPTAAKRWIDEEAERRRQKYITPGDGKVLAYQEMKEQAGDVIAALEENPAGLESQDYVSLTTEQQAELDSKYPMLTAEIGYFGMTCLAVAETVLTQYEAFRLIERSLIKTVRKAKADIAASKSMEEINSVLASIIWEV